MEWCDQSGRGTAKDEDGEVEYVLANDRVHSGNQSAQYATFEYPKHKAEKKKPRAPNPAASSESKSVLAPLNTVQSNAFLDELP